MSAWPERWSGGFRLAARFAIDGAALCIVAEAEMQAPIIPTCFERA